VGTEFHARWPHLRADGGSLPLNQRVQGSSPCAPTIERASDLVTERRFFESPFARRTVLTTLIDGLATPTSPIVIYSVYSVAYRSGKADKLASRLLSDPHSVKIVAADNNFSIPTADLGKAFAVDEQCYPLWVGHALKWR
jgi:hypothetical protein